jgi:hypothetical protein
MEARELGELFFRLFTVTRPRVRFEFREFEPPRGRVIERFLRLGSGGAQPGLRGRESFVIGGVSQRGARLGQMVLSRYLATAQGGDNCE